MATFEELGIEIKYTRGGNQKVKCPQCSHSRRHKTDKSLSVNMTDKTFNCHNCGWSGRATDLTDDEIKLNRHLNQMQFQKQKRKPYNQPEQTIIPLSGEVIKFFKNRGIEAHTLDYFKVSESMEWMPAKGDKEAATRRAINFNYYRNGQKVNIKYRDALKAFKMVKDAELILYNIDILKDRNEMLICEGEIDCMTFYQCGYYGAVSVPNGASKGSAKLEYLDNCVDVFDRMTKIIIAVDGDEAGEYLKNELARRLGKHRCWFVTYPEGCKDANEVLQKYGPDAVRELYQSATAPPLEHVLQPDDMASILYDVWANGYPKTDPIGYEKFDQHLRFARGELTTVTGIPGHGKGEFIDQICVRLAARHDWHIGVFSFEEVFRSKGPKICSKFIGEKFYDENPNRKISASKLTLSTQFLIEYFSFIDIERENFTIDAILDKGKELVLRKNISMLVIDPYNCIESSQPKDMTETQYISVVMGKMARFAKAYDVAVLFVAHPTKMSKDQNGVWKVPNLYDISGSANFFNKTHNGFTVYRHMDHETGKPVSTIYIQKVKNSWNGELGAVDFEFDIDTGRYAELGVMGGFTKESEHFLRRINAAGIQLETSFSEPLIVSANPTSPEPANNGYSLNVFPSTDLSKWNSPLPDDQVPF